MTTYANGSKLITVSADATAGALQQVIRDTFPGTTRADHVSDGRWASTDLPPADAHKLAAVLRERGYKVTVR